MIKRDPCSLFMNWIRSCLIWLWPSCSSASSSLQTITPELGIHQWYQSQIPSPLWQASGPLPRCLLLHHPSLSPPSGFVYMPQHRLHCHLFHQVSITSSFVLFLLHGRPHWGSNWDLHKGRMCSLHYTKWGVHHLLFSSPSKHPRNPCYFHIRISSSFRGRAPLFSWPQVLNISWILGLSKRGGLETDSINKLYISSQITPWITLVCINLPQVSKIVCNSL